jgi:hypothetical protein
VTDPSGAAIPGARVTARNTATGYALSTTSGPNGVYLFPNLPVGSYDLTVRRSGFTTYVHNGITLTVNQAATQNVTLQVGQITQEVTVRANTMLVTTESAALGQIVNQRDVVDLPLNGREVQQLVFLAPSTADVSGHYCGANCEGGTLPGEQYAKVNGTTSNGVNYQMDGTDNNDTYTNANLPFPDPDAV